MSEKKVTFETLGINLIDEITSLLLPRDIVSLIGANKYLYRLGSNSRITNKIFSNKIFSFEVAPRERWLLYQIRFAYLTDGYPKLKRIGSCKKIHVLDISYDPLSLILFLNNKLAIWKPDTNETDILDIPEINLTHLSAHAISFENNKLAIMYTNNIIRFISDFKFVRDIEMTEIDHLSITKMFFLHTGELLVLLTCVGNAIFMTNNGEIISNKRFGLISKYKILPSRTDAFVALINRDMVVITPKGKKILCSGNFNSSTPPDFWIDKEQKKLIIHNPYSPAAIKVKDFSPFIDIKTFPLKMHYVEGHVFTDSKGIGNLKDQDAGDYYSINKPPTDVYGDKKLILVHSSYYSSAFYLCLWGENEPIYTKELNSIAEIIGYKYPYIIYMMTSSKGIAEINVLRF